MSHRGEIVRSGYLTKSPPDFKVAAQWHRRWFVLADSKLVYPLADRYVRLEYYQSEAEARKCADPKGVINLKVCTLVTSRESIKGHKHVFDVRTEKRVYHLAADSTLEKVEWITTLNKMLFVEKELPGQVRHGRWSPPVPHRHHSDSDPLVRGERKPRPLSCTSDPNAMSRPLPPVPSSNPQTRPLPPTPGHSQPHLLSHSPGSSQLSTSPMTNSPLISAQIFRGQRSGIPSKHRSFEDLGSHYEVGPGQRSIIPDAARPGHPKPQKPVHQEPGRQKPPRPKVLPRNPRGQLRKSGSADSEYVNTENGSPGVVESEYSVLQESMTGYVPNSDDYSHLGYVTPPRERRTAPEVRARPRQQRRPRAGEYENRPHIEPDSDDYSHLTH